MRGISSHPEYADANGGFDSLMTPNVINFAAKGKTFFDEAYAAINSKGARIRERDERRYRIRRLEIPLGRTEPENCQISYDDYKEVKRPVLKPSTPIGEPGLAAVAEETQQKGRWVNGKWRVGATKGWAIETKFAPFYPPGWKGQIPLITDIRRHRP